MATVGEHLQVSSHTADKVTKLKLSLENFYSNLVAQHEEREHRSVGGQCSGQSQDPFFVTWLALLSVLQQVVQSVLWLVAWSARSFIWSVQWSVYTDTKSSRAQQLFSV